ncbi:MAG: tRNA pseudouridine(55) synthase TruB [Steroidobacteraceae bacterium]
MSSAAAVGRVRHLLGRPKVGHAGTLDPLATGMLPLCVGEATKLVSYLMQGRKGYEFCISLGSRTSTGDNEGEVVATAPVPALDMDRVISALRSFEGAGTQIPPMYSALKHEGQRLYKLAREGQVIERKSRPIVIDALQLRELGASHLRLHVLCSKGTYVRVLAEDIASALGTVGHCSSLRRSYVEPFAESDMIKINELEDRIARGEDPGLLAPDAALGHLPAALLAAEAARRIMQGQPIACPADLTSNCDPSLERVVRLYGADGGFIGLGSGPDAGGRLRPLRLIASAAGDPKGSFISRT